MSLRYFLVESPNWANQTDRQISKVEITKAEYDEYHNKWKGYVNPEIGMYNTDGTDNILESIEISTD